MDKCGNYFIEDLERLGRGGFGEVYKVNVHNLTKTHISVYARKYFLPSPENDATSIREIADLRERFIVEIKTQSRLNSVNNDVFAPIVLFHKNGEKPYFVMELAECNLADAIKSGQSGLERETAVHQIIFGIKIIHDNSYLHRDLKPANILKYPGQKFKISDFGLVKDSDDLRAEIKTRFNPNGIGSEGYRAPEIIENGLFSPQSDIYALGKIINDIYAGKASKKIKKIISKCTEYFPENRYETADEVLSAFSQIIKNTEVA
jgi:serine/threonine protein kinase